MFLAGNGVISSAMKRVALQNAHQSQPRTFEHAVAVYRFIGIMRAGGVKATAPAQIGGNGPLVETDQ